ncbi:MAG: hypothetical protein RL681_299 [Candidatus Parcubacteria bacterium]|jgi:hypothetical protein
MGKKSSNTAIDRTQRRFVVVRLAREWQPYEIQNFRTNLSLHGQRFVEPTLSRDRLEISFRDDDCEEQIVRRLLDRLTPPHSRPEIEVTR